MQETGIDHVRGEDYITYYSSETKYINKLRKQMELNPGCAEIKMDDGDTLMVKLPLSWFRPPSPPAKRRPMSEEQRKAASERMKRLVSSQK